MGLVKQVTSPPVTSQLTRWSGSLAPNSKYRRKIILNTDDKKGFNFPDDPELSGKPNYSWAEVLSRVFGIEVLKCDCGGRWCMAIKKTDFCNFV